MMNRQNLIADLASRFLAAQLTQIKLWEADDIDTEKLEKLCIQIAENIIIRSVEAVHG